MKPLALGALLLFLPATASAHPTKRFARNVARPMVVAQEATFGRVFTNRVGRHRIVASAGMAYEEGEHYRTVFLIAVERCGRHRCVRPYQVDVNPRGALGFRDYPVHRCHRSDRCGRARA